MYRHVTSVSTGTCAVHVAESTHTFAIHTNASITKECGEGYTVTCDLFNDITAALNRLIHITIMHAFFAILYMVENSRRI
jgi:hypothetical protein